MALYKLFRKIFFFLVAPFYVRFNRKFLQVPRVQFIYFHHLFSAELKGFKTFLNESMEIYQIISTSEALDKLRTGVVDRPYLSISSDDGFESNILASEVLHEYGIKACFFVPTSYVGEKLSKRSEKVFGFERMDFCTLADLQSMLSKGHEIGNHTVSHHNLNNMSETVIMNEIIQASEYLEANNIYPRHFAFPYGSKEFHSSIAKNICVQHGMNYFSAIRGSHSEYPKDNILFRDLVIFGKFNKIEFLYFNIRNAKKLLK